MSDEILSALIAATATLIAGLLPFFYALVKVRRLSSNETVDSLTTFILSSYSFFHVGRIRILKLYSDETIVIDQIDDFSISALDVREDWAVLSIVSQNAKPQRHFVEQDWVNRFSCKGTNYRLTLLRFIERRRWYEISFKKRDPRSFLSENRPRGIILELRKLNTQSRVERKPMKG